LGNAERHFQQAIKSSPRYATAHHWYATSCLLPFARFEESRRELQLARELEPLSLVISATWGLQLFLERRYDGAIREFLRIITLDHNFGMSHFFLGQTYSEQGMFNEAIRESEASADLNGHSPESVAILGRAYARAGQAEKATKVLEDLRQMAYSVYVSPVLYAQLVLALGETKESSRLP
jgi:tetratricopeptide (TPR) repeat protein